MKSVELAPLGSLMDVPTGTRLLDGLLAMKFKINMACGGRGLCATCHVRVRRGQDDLSPRTPREEKTLNHVHTADHSSRLACQSHIMGEGVVVELPVGIYVQSVEVVASLVGGRSEHDFLHPINGQVLIAKGKVITRTMLQLFVTLSEELRKLREEK